MTTFRSIPLTKIWYNKTDRQRQEIGDISDLAASIKQVGMINPPVVTREFQLVAGERRYLAAQSLGWSHLTVQFLDELSDEEKEQIELDENLKRLDLSWQEKCLGIARYHDLCVRRENGKWSSELTAVALGFSPKSSQAINDYLYVAEALKSGDKRIAEAPKFSVAVGIVERAKARQRDSQAEEVTRLLAPTTTDADLEEAVHFALTTEEPDDESLPPLIRADFIEWAAGYKGQRFNLLHCDFPYGINADKHDQGSAKDFGGYEDSEEIYFELIAALGAAMETVVAPAAHMVFWYATKFHAITLEMLTHIGWTVNPTPLVWWRSDNSGVLPDPRRMPRQVYETAFLCTRGDRFLSQARSNLIAAPNTKQFHMSEKPMEVVTHFLSMLVDETSVVLDPTAGSGNAIIAAHKLGAKVVLGLEVNEEFHANAIRNWKEKVDAQ